VKRLALLSLLLAACGPRPAIDLGRELFSDARLSTADSNVFSCATCHEVGAPALPLPGYTMLDAARRPSYWGGSVGTLFDAVNQCLTQFMKSRAITIEEENGRALHVYLQSLVTAGPAPALPLTIVRNIADVPSGDGGRGKGVYDGACAPCHGAPSSGDGRIGKIASIIPNDTVNMFGSHPKTGARPITIEKIRHGKFFGVGGVMAPFSLEVLSEAQLGDLLAYLQGFGLPPSQ
jgi:thiosulfate dehydrogenase